MHRQLVDRRRQAEQLGLRDAVECNDSLHLRGAQRDGAGLVEEHGACLAQTLERRAALHDHPCPRRPRHPGDERDRGREDQWARRRDDKHGEGTNGVAAESPGSTGHGNREREEERGVPVGEPDEGGALRLGLAHEANERRVGAFRGGPECAQLEDLPGVRRAAPHRFAPVERRRERLPGQRRLVDDGLVALDDSVDRDDLAAPHDHHVADVNRVRRHLLDDRACSPVGDLRRPLDERSQFPPRAPSRRLLQSVSPGEHQRDHRSRNVFAEGERTGDRDDRDRVDADVAGENGPSN